MARIPRRNLLSQGFQPWRWSSRFFEAEERGRNGGDAESRAKLENTAEWWWNRADSFDLRHFIRLCVYFFAYNLPAPTSSVPNICICLAVYTYIHIYIRWNWKGTLAASFQKKMWYALFLLAKILRGKRKEREKKKGEVEAFGCFPRSSSEYFISQFRLRSFGHSRPTCTSLRLNET